MGIFFFSLKGKKRKNKKWISKREKHLLIKNLKATTNKSSGYTPVLIFHIDIQYILNYQLKTYHLFSNSYTEQRNKTRVTLDVDLKTFPNMNMMELRC